MRNLVQGRVASSMTQCCKIMYSAYVNMRDAGYNTPIEALFCNLSAHLSTSNASEEAVLQEQFDKEYYSQLCLLAKAGDYFNHRKFDQVN